jgi:hypothetical protein
MATFIAETFMGDNFNMIIFNYPSKKELTANVGKPLKYIETSLFGAEYVR